MASEKGVFPREESPEGSAHGGTHPLIEAHKSLFLGHTLDALKCGTIYSLRPTCNRGGSALALKPGLDGT